MLQVAKKARPLPSSPYQMGRRMDLPVLFCAVCDARLPGCAQYQWHGGCRVSGARGCMPSALALGPAGLEMAATCTSTRSGARPRCLRAHQQLLALSRQRRKLKLLTLTSRRFLAAGGAETDEVVAQLRLTERGERDSELGEEVAALPVTPPAAAAEINAAQIGAAKASDADEIVEDVAQEAPEQAPLEMNQ